MLFALAVGLTISQSARTAAPIPDRMTQIWNAVSDRMTDQVDEWFEEGEFPKVIQLLRFQFAMYPNDYEIATNLGWMCENVEDYDMATKVYQDFNRLNPTDPDAALPLGEMLFRRANNVRKNDALRNSLLNQAIAVLEPTLKKKGMHGNNYRILASSYERLGRFKDAKRILEIYIKIAPNDGQAKVNLARVEKKLQSQR